MRTIAAAVVGMGLAGLAALWAWLGREARDRGAYVSDEWRAAYRRGLGD